MQKPKRVTLFYYGGPLDGAVRETDSRSFRLGWVSTSSNAHFPRGRYVSENPWKGEEWVAVSWEYYTPQQLKEREDYYA